MYITQLTFALNILLILHIHLEYLDSNITEICLQWCNKHKASIGPNNGLAPIRRHTFIWTNEGLVYWRIHTSLGLNELMSRSSMIPCEIRIVVCMTTSSYGNIFRVTGPLCGEFTGRRWIPLTKARDTELWCFLWYVPEKNGWVNNREAGNLRRHRAHYIVIVMNKENGLYLHIPLRTSMTFCVDISHELGFSQWKASLSLTELMQGWFYVCAQPMSDGITL